MGQGENTAAPVEELAERNAPTSLSNATLAAITRAAQRINLTDRQSVILHERLLSEKPTLQNEIAARWGWGIFSVRKTEADLRKAILERLSLRQQDEAREWFRLTRSRALQKPLEHNRLTGKRLQTKYRERLKSYKPKYESLRLALADWFSRQPEEWQQGPNGQEFKIFLTASGWVNPSGMQPGSFSSQTRK